MVPERPSSKTAPPGRLLERAFFEAPPERVAPRLLGKLLISKTSAGLMAGRIVEVEAYLGPHRQPADPAAHAHRGLTERNRVLFGPAGHAYVYAIYGRYFCMNISCEREGRAGSVLLRALEPLAGLEQMVCNRGLGPDAEARELTCGPGRLCQALDLKRETHNGLDLLDPRSPLQVRDDGMRVTRVLVTPRIGIRHAVELPLRFAVPRHECVSGPRKVPGKCIDLRVGGLRFSAARE
ncbi:MAG: DNA-3-methyladenine glycosylase [Terracidiphilus sp.]